ncbi:DUF4336 domain-containing protein [Thalassospira marina]|uniref:DUF4336 domain-containing protein n=1 Tax=Thalassospira marina TaxID=2048283 RepID=A0ABM6Q774_9PROT|nr:DUF4336 domain-containing protein [Thalassospira marina]AUG52337.1 DUF4336 domain-containing protein [Thalassospira marina]
MFEIETYHPLNVLKQVDNDIWLVDGPVIGFRYLGLSLPFPTRMTIIRQSNGEIWLHSPVKLSPALQVQIDALGPVRYLIAPNTIHYASIPQWQRAYPDAQSFGVKGIAKRAKANGIEVKFDHLLGDVADPGWSGEIDQLVVRGGYLTEAVFFHRASRTLILTDLIENFEPGKIKSPIWRFLVRLFGSMDPHGAAPRDMRATFMGHKPALRNAVDQMIAWKPDRVILAHGRWYDSNAIAELKRAFSWV